MRKTLSSFAASFSDLLQGQSALDAMADRQEEIRTAMLASLSDIESPHLHAFSKTLVTITQASDVQSLWDVRSELLRLIAERHGEQVARQTLDGITAMFRGLVPRNLLPSRRRVARGALGADHPRPTENPTQTPQPVFALEWREGFCMGIDSLDREHRQLFAMVLALNLGTVENTMSQLLDYVVTHFSHEQEAMEQSGYPAFEQHLRLHEAFASEIAEYLMVNDGWTEERVKDLRRFLNKWLISHNMTHDIRFGKWLAAKNGGATMPVAARTGLVGRLLG